jgi:mRNA interferase MazF
MVMTEILDDFDQWNSKKRKINGKLIPKGLHFAEREIWWIAMGKNVGSEENGKNEDFERPGIIFRSFGIDTLWIIPLTTSFPIIDERREYQFSSDSIDQIADLAQLRLISSKRLLRRKGILNFKDFQNIRRLLRELM